MVADVIETIRTKELQAIKFGMHNTASQAQTSGANQAAAPAGGTGQTAGAYDTAAHRDAAIALLNEIRTTLVANGMMKGGA